MKTWHLKASSGGFYITESQCCPDEQRAFLAVFQEIFIPEQQAYRALKRFLDNDKFYFN